MKLVISAIRKDWKQILIFGFIYLITICLFSGITDEITKSLGNNFLQLESLKFSMTTFKNIFKSILIMFSLCTFLLAVFNIFLYAWVLILKSNIIAKEAIKKALKKTFKLIIFSFFEIVLVSIGFIFFIIPGFYLALIMGFAIVIAAKEDISLLNGIKQAKQTVKGHFWTIFWYFSLIKLGLFLAVIVLNMVQLNGIYLLADLIIPATFIYVLTKDLKNETTLNV